MNSPLDLERFVQIMIGYDRKNGVQNFIEQSLECFPEEVRHGVRVLLDKMLLGSLEDLLEVVNEAEELGFDSEPIFSIMAMNLQGVFDE